MMSNRPPVWPHALENELWAKSAGKGKDGKPESLAEHTWLVLERLADFIHLRPGLPARLGRPSLWNYLYWATFLHDFGKAAPPFQRLLRNDPSARADWGGHRHELFSLAFVDWLSPGLDIDDLTWAVAAIISHHRDREEMVQLYTPPPPGTPDDVVKILAQVPVAHIDGLYKWLTSCGWPWAQHLGLDAVGITPIPFPVAMPLFQADDAVRRIYEWLEQYEELGDRSSTPVERVDLIALRGHILSADHSGSAHAPDLPRVHFRPEDVLTSRHLTWGKLYSHQRGCNEEDAIAMQDEQALCWGEGSALLVAPTGTGKTEAALLWAARQTASSNSPRLFYTLPYQASMNAMLRRLEETFGQKYVEVQHGRALLATYRWLMEKGETPENAARNARSRRNLAGLHYPPVRVFSPYQMLKGMYRLKGYEAQLTDYHDGLFIFDEIHAYQVNRLALILRTIAYLRRHYNARFLVMSATFPALIRGWLAEALGETPTITATPALYAEFQRHRIRLVEGEALDEANLARVRDAAVGGKSVLLVCNIVARAQQAHDWLRDQLAPHHIETVLLHGRFNMRDRQQKERFIHERTGADRKGDRRPVVLVATQAVEVSLDIDLDTLYSEPAPLEALLQRFGRVNRRGRKDIADVHVFTTPPDAQKKIYNPELVARTLRVLARKDGRAVDESAVGCWLDEIYEGEIAAQWRAEYAQVAAEFDAAVVDTLRPFQSDRDMEARFDKLFDGVEVLPAGDDDAIVKEYDALVAEGKLIEAGELLVSISYRQFHQIKRADLLWEKGRPDDGRGAIVVSAPYTRENGLEVNAAAQCLKEEEEPGI